MGMFALLTATRDRLRQRLGLERNECRVCKSARPPAMAGDIFYSVFALSWSPGDTDLNRGLDEYYGIGICLSCRTNHIPDDDQAEESFIKVGSSIEANARRVIAEIHENADLMVAANVFLGSDPDKIIEYLRWQSADPSPVEVPASWFSGGYLDENIGGEDMGGLTLTINFGQARRTQAYSRMR